MKKLVCFLLALCLLCGMAYAASAEADSGVIEHFLQPNCLEKPMVRMWFPDGSAGLDEYDTVQEQIEQLAEAGFGGVEVAYLADGSLFSNDDAAVYGWGTSAWNETLKKVLRAANAIEGGFVVDITFTPHWPLCINTIDPNDAAASAIMTCSYTKVESLEQQLDLPGGLKTADAAKNPFVFTDTFDSAALVQVKSVDGGSLVLDEATMTDITAQVEPEGVEAWKAGIPDEEYFNAHAQEYGWSGDYESAVVSVFGEGPENFDANDETNVSPKMDSEFRRVRLADTQYYPVAALDTVLTAEDIRGGESIEAGDWLVVAVYYRGTGQIFSDGAFGGTSESMVNNLYVPNYLDASGIEVVADYWEKYILSDPELKALMEENAAIAAEYGGQPMIFEDSLELTGSPLWSAGMEEKAAAYFGAGYDGLMSARYAVSRLSGLSFGGEDAGDTGASSEASGEASGEIGAASGEYAELKNYLLATEHYGQVSQWAADNCCGYGFRVQYDADTLAADEANIDVIEGDNGSKGDGLRQRASFKNLFGKTLLSMEAATGMETYSLNWADVLIELSQNYSQGVNHVILHGSSYNKSGNGYNAQWPGWSGFGSGFADDYNARTAYWPWARSFTGYMARTQAVLQSGTQKQDLAVFSTGWSELLNHGYCYDILSDALLAAAEDSSVSADGSIFSDGPGYRAVVISESELSALGAENREKILTWAAAGLPVFVIGEAAPDGCIAVSDKGDALLAALEDAGIYAAAAYKAESLVAQHYRDETDGAEYYLLYNDYNSSGNENMLNAGIGQSLKAGAAIETSVTLHGSGVPVELDAVTGEIFRLTRYEDNGDGTITLPVALSSRETMIIGLVDEETAQRYATADAVVYGGESGRAALELGEDWALTIYSKGPDYGEENVQGEVTSLEDGLTRTIYYDPTASLWTELDMGSVSLGDGVWSALEAPAALNAENFHSAKDALTMTDVSGVGVYTRSFVLDEWDGTEAAVLALEHRQDEIVSVSVNGVSLGAFDNVTDCIDISAGLREGENEITVVLATTLLNRALAENEAFDGTQKHPGTQAGPQEYGLSGACIRFYSVEN